MISEGVGRDFMQFQRFECNIFQKFNIIIIIVFLLPTYFSLGEMLPSQLFFNVSKPNLINVLFHTDNFAGSKIIRKQCTKIPQN